MVLSSGSTLEPTGLCVNPNSVPHPSPYQLIYSWNMGIFMFKIGRIEKYHAKDFLKSEAGADSGLML